MEAKELMVGDKVLVKVLSQIPETYVPHTWCEEDYTRNLQVKPIPLTAERLEKNGFELNEEDDWFEYENNHRYVVVSFCRDLDTDEIQNDSFMIFNGCDCRYFHELQQALRLCGLNEIANNLTI